MPRTTLTKITPKGPNPGTVAATDLNFTLTAADVANKNQFAPSGNDLVIAQNVNVAAQTLTLTSTTDPFKRTGDITAYSLGAGLFAAFFYGEGVGWRQADGFVYLEAAHVDIKFAVFAVPRQ